MKLLRLEAGVWHEALLPDADRVHYYVLDSWHRLASEWEAA